MERKMPIRRRSARLSSGGRRRSARLDAAAAPGQYPGSWKLKQQREPSSSLVPSTMKKWKHKAKKTQSAERSGKTEDKITQSAESSGNGKHFWSLAEEQAYVNAVTELAPKYRGWNSEFYQAIADAVNKECSHLRKDYVHLDILKVKAKRADCKRCLKSYTRPDQQFCIRIGSIDPPFGTGYPMDSSSGAVAGPSTVKDEGIHAALQDLKSFGCKGLDLVKYAHLLNDQHHLDVFWAHGCRGQKMEQKISYLDEASGFSTPFVSLSSVVQEPRVLFTEFKKAALNFMIANRVASNPFSNHELFVSSYLLEDKVIRDVFGAYESYPERREFLLSQIEEVLMKVLGASSSCQLSQASRDY
ncbi:uncharacterized protein [Miscanthus floridulus]|uniref:uncharacterized protein isoform X3 n=1 Tax=Miscanthus floridulus TaxID=154761 RepID=UPI0034580F29